MGDCSSISRLTPYETYRCFVEADIWKTIGHNGQRMWNDFTGTTNGEWAELVFAFAQLPAQFASYFLPFYFLARVFNRARWRGKIVTTDKQQKSKKRWSLHLVICGLFLVCFFPNDKFMLYQGMWEIICGVAIVLFGSSFWASSGSYRQTVSNSEQPLE